MLKRPRRVTLIANPGAGAGRARRLLPRVLAALGAAGCDPVVLETNRPGDATRLATMAAPDGALAVLGGDGTLNEVINGIAGRDVPLAFLPAGSGNDAARSLGLPLDPIAAARALIDGREVWVDVGIIAARRFCNVAGVGLDGEVCRLLAAGAIPLRGRAAYVAAFLATAANLRATPLWLQEDDGPWQRLDALLVTFANGPYYGGGMRIAPNADLRDGALDRCALLATGKLELVRAFPRVYRGAHVTHPSIRMGRACTIRLYGRRPLALHADGEPAGRLSRDAQNPTLVHIASQRQRFLMPAM